MAQAELGERADCRPGATLTRNKLPLDPSAFANGLGETIELGELRTIDRRRYMRRKARVRPPSKIGPHVGMIESWLAAEPQLTAIAILGRLSEHFPGQFGNPQHSKCNVC